MLDLICQSPAGAHVSSKQPDGPACVAAFVEAMHERAVVFRPPAMRELGGGGPLSWVATRR
jgi:hypothetical protein